MSFLGARGYYPDFGDGETNFDLFNGNGVGGQVHRDDDYLRRQRNKGALVVSIEYKLDFSQFSNAESTLRSWSMNSPRYSFIPQNFCSTFVRDIVRSTGNYFPSGSPNSIIPKIDMYNFINRKE